MGGSNGDYDVFTASFDKVVVSKTQLDGLAPVWVPGDSISVYDGDNLKFVNTNSEVSSKAKFQGKLVNTDLESYLAISPYDPELYFSPISPMVYGVKLPEVQKAVKNSYDPSAAAAIAYTKTKSFSFKNLVSLVKFQLISDGVESVTLYANSEEHIAGTYNAIYDEQPRVFVTSGKSSITLNGAFEKDAVYYIAVLPSSLERGITVLLNGNVRTLLVDAPIEFVRNGVINLGTLSLNPSESQKPTNPDEGEDDAVASAWGLLGAHNGWNTAEPTPMYEIGSNFVAFDVPAEVAGGFKFKNGDTWVGTASAVSVDAWVNAQDGDAGQNIAFTGTATAYDIYFATSLKAFYITAAGNPAPEALPKPFSGMTVAGTFNGWATAANPTEAEGDYYVLKGIKAAMVNSADATGGDKGFKFVYTEEDGAQTWYGAPSAIVETSKWYNVNSDGAAANVYVTGDADADYDVYISKDRKIFCVVPAGAELPAEGEVGDGGVSGGTTPELSEASIYLKPNVWSSDSPRFEAYFFGNGEAWVTMTQVAEGVFECKIPVGFSNVIFVRMDSLKPEHSWESKWNQTEDLTISSDKNCFTVNSWDGGVEGKSTGVWSAYASGSTETPTPETPETENPEHEVQSMKLYLDPWQWTSDNAVISAYFFGGPSGDQWVSMTKEGNYYVCEIPEGYPSVIFVRLNPAGAANNWDSKWNQTIDLTITSDKNLFTINSWDGGADGKSTGVWSTK